MNLMHPAPSPDPAEHGPPGAGARHPVRRLGILGGSFDPIHVAHLISAEAVREALSLDLVLFAPVRQQPLKRSRVQTAPEHRVAMVQLAIAGNPYFALSRVDVDRQGPSYTVRTLELLQQEWSAPELRLWFIIGSDSLFTFPSWHDPAGILAQARLAVVRRPGTQLDRTSLYNAVQGLESSIDWVDAPLIDVSATDLRRRVAEGLSIRYRLPEAVGEYIETHGLYK
ncbi:MAG: nicotinate-nucleotide adenylyltransferase [Chloroflexota bacterium]|nr:nicotinate-nucleotide adenylyltransferase [Chloroflexota bacterium]